MAGSRTNWRDYILQHFREPIHRLTLVADPDGLMLEEELLATIRLNGFDLLPFEDHVAFRYAYESSYRQRWDEGYDTGLVVILRSPEARLRSLPYDLLQSGRTLSFGLPDLFPRLSYPVVRDLDRNHLQSLYEAYQQYMGPEMGDRASAAFVLKHVFGTAPDTIKTRAELLKLLLARHMRGERVPPRIDAFLLGALRRQSELNAWPLEKLLDDAKAFYAFLQERWRGYLASRQPAELLTRETGPTYDFSTQVPYDDPDIRAYVNTLFLDGKLKPVPLPEHWTVEGWAEIGVEADKEAFETRRFAGLLENMEYELPAVDATHHAWTAYAVRWAELTVLRHRLASGLGEDLIDQFRALHLRLEERFADWMMARYHTLHSLPFLPAPVMAHRVVHYMAASHSGQPDRRLALIVVDGLALDQWIIIRDCWAEEPNDLLVDESALFAWAPTLTSISRQAIFSGTTPQFFSRSWQTTEKEPSLWQRFWYEHDFHPASVGYLRNLGVKDLDEGALAGGEATLEPELQVLLEDPQARVVGLVLNTVDNIMHGMQLGTAGMHQQMRLWVSRYRYLTKLVGKLIGESFAVYLISDHGNVWARGMGKLSEGVLVEKRGERARIYANPAFLDMARKQSPTAIKWSNVGLPAELNVLLAPQLDAFLGAGDHAVCHGGIALEEVIVPFVEISRK